MKWKSAPRDFIIYFIFLIGITLNIIDSTFKFVDIKYDIRIAFLIAASILIYLWLSINNKYAALLILIPVFIFKPSRIIEFTNYLVNNYKDFIHVMFASQYIPHEFIKYYINFVYAVMSLSLIAVYFLVVIKKNTTILLFAGSGIYVSYYYLGNNDMFKGCSIFLILTIILYAFNEYVKKRDRWSSGDSDVKKNYFYRWISLTVILVLFTNFITQLFKYDIKPITFDWFEENIVNRFESLTGRSDRRLSESGLKEKFNLTFTGYQENPGQLGGPINMDNSIAFRVYSDKDVSNLHLRGSISDSYTGHVWKKTDEKTEKVEGEINSGLTVILKEEYKKIKITPAKIETTTAFNSLYPVSVSNSWKYVLVDSDMGIYHPRVARRTKSYEVNFKEYDAAEIQKSLMTLNYDLNNKIYDDNIKKYLKLPDIPSRVFDLTMEITSKYKTPFEKASAIEKYLKDNYPYSTETSIVPGNRDFVDYFLFDEKKGYCTYYATAMAVMARIINLPSRYVEGYAYQGIIRGSQEMNILNSDAHAWVEIYFDGIGWAAFDPTPGMSSIALDLKSDTDGGANAPQDNDQESDASGDTPARLQAPRPQDGTIETDNVEVHTNDSINIMYIVYPISAILILGLIALIWSMSLLKRKRYIYYSLQKLIIYGKYINIEYSTGMTIREFLERLGRVVDMELDEYILLYEGMLYGEASFKKRHRKKLDRMLRNIKGEIIRQGSRLKFYIFDITRTALLPLKGWGCGKRSHTRGEL
ncbi:transglutaminase-like domain-containing protein [Fonticella tunisiensis]|uniref:Transglutaminase superfamily protein n=1 Tax=Fonticella tunisiensis TaxID=1096341 RepID=A0A4R7K9H4_9CLOT|nr:transglutaminase-like domain-containing protein [Fonticella tunisiensis]TDT50719.1 transglutaminase superfamily protein [Fonticella tunisiensis]